MPELIDRETLLHELCGMCCAGEKYKCRNPLGECDEVTVIKKQPAIEAEPVLHGEWHECWYTDTVCASICTNCGKAATQARVIVGQELMTNVRYPLCPNCGARMYATDTNVGGKGGDESACD